MKRKRGGGGGADTDGGAATGVVVVVSNLPHGYTASRVSAVYFYCSHFF